MGVLILTSSFLRIQVAAQWARRFWAWSLTRHLFAFLIVPNLIFVFVGYHWFLVREPINVDYLLLALLYLLLGPVVTAVTAAAIFLLDVVESGVVIFHFTLETAMEALQFTTALPSTTIVFVLLSVLAAAGSFGLLTYLVTRNASLSRGGAIALCLLAVLFSGVDNAILHTSINRGDYVKKTKSLLPDIARTAQGIVLGNSFGELVGPASSASAPIFTALEASDPLPPNIVLVIVESWGLMKADPAMTMQWRVLEDSLLLEKYEIQQSTVKFVGSTVPAEFRELCRIRYLTEDPDLADVDTAQCLPELLKSLGYHSVALHGFHGEFFDRRRWYPDIGFDEVLLLDDIEERIEGHRYCGEGLFEGLCDRDVVGLVRRLLLDESGEKKFIYWLTLNGHFPVTPPADSLSDIECNDVNTLQSDPGLCALVKRHELVLSAVRKLAVDSPEGTTLFVVVGDHSPQFVVRDRRDEFDEDEVPFVVLWPDDGEYVEEQF